MNKKEIFKRMVLRTPLDALFYLFVPLVLLALLPVFIDDFPWNLGALAALLAVGIAGRTDWEKAKRELGS